MARRGIDRIDRASGALNVAALVLALVLAAGGALAQQAQPAEEGPPAALAPAAADAVAADAAEDAEPPGPRRPHFPSFMPEAARDVFAAPKALPPPVLTRSQPMGTATVGAAASPEPPAAAPAQQGPPAKQLFGAAKSASPLAARAIGSYARGCLAGAKALPIDGPAWQAMRLSRNRNWGHPRLIALVERLATEAREHDGWPGLLVGDLSQPRGGPMLTGHASHQIGLDADIWFTPMPDRRLSEKEREELSATSLLGDDELSVRADVWTEAHLKLVKRAASYPEVERVLVHPAIKNLMCNLAGADRGWLGKVRPIWGHYYHFHVRIGCPKDSVGCVSQAPPSGDDGCGKELVDWYALLVQPPKPPPAKPAPPKPPMTMAELPAECRVVLDAGTEREGTALLDKAAAPAAAPAPAKPAPAKPAAKSAAGSEKARAKAGRDTRSAAR